MRALSPIHPLYFLLLLQNMTKRKPGRWTGRSWHSGINTSAKQAITSGVGVEFVSESFVECLCLTRSQFAAVVATYPTEVQVWAILYLSALNRLLHGINACMRGCFLLKNAILTGICELTG